MTIKTLAVAGVALAAAVAAACTSGCLRASAVAGSDNREETIIAEREQVSSPASTSANGGGSASRRSAAVTPPRFFFAGDGRLTLRHAHFGTQLDVRYRRSDGRYDPDALAQIQRFFRSRNDGREAAISLRLIELLGFVQTRYQAKQMVLISGYRSPELNAELRAAGGAQAQTSLHTQGLAADVAFPGTDVRRLWRELRALRAGGAGYYRSGRFLHIDSGPPRFWEERTSRVRENLSGDNARVFVRTDFDRYVGLAGARLRFYSITAFPLLVATRARVVGPQGVQDISLAPADHTVLVSNGECIAIAAPSDAYELAVTATDSLRSGRAALRVNTCAPRIGKTASEIESNPIEIVSPR